MKSEKSFSLQQIAEHLGGIVVGDGSVRITGLASLADAGPEDLSFFGSEKYLSVLGRTRAGAVLVKEPVPASSVPQVTVPDPFLAMSTLAELVYPPELPVAGVHQLADVSASATIGAEVSVLPFAHIGAGATLGARTVVHPGVYIGDHAVVGEDVTLWPNVVVRDRCSIGDRVIIHPGAIIGADGFGYARRDGKFFKIRHVGRVVLEDDVEIGANATIDRATFGTTIVRRGVKLDNLVHIAHNVDIGEDTAMAAQGGISGSSVVGKRVRMGGQVGVADGCTVGDDAILIGQAGVIGDIPAKTIVSDYPARPHREILKAHAGIRSLDRLKRRVKALEQRLRTLEAKPDEDSQT